MKRVCKLLLPLALMFVVTSGTLAEQGDEWRFGIGTGLSSFSLDGDIGFATPDGGVIADVDLDNSDTSDLVESGLGFSTFAAKGRWKILVSAGTVTLEDRDGDIEADWDRTQAEVAGVYTFAVTGRHAWGALVGVRYTDHDWSIKTPDRSYDVDESWTDGIVGITHAVPIGSRWSWSNRVDAGFGGSEGSYLFQTGVNWKASDHWLFNLSLMAKSVEYGEKSDIDDSDFYLYDVDEPTVGIGFMYTW